MRCIWFYVGILQTGKLQLCCYWLIFLIWLPRYTWFIIYCFQLILEISTLLSSLYLTLDGYGRHIQSVYMEGCSLVDDTLYFALLKVATSTIKKGFSTVLSSFVSFYLFSIMAYNLVLRMQYKIWLIRWTWKSFNMNKWVSFLSLKHKGLEPCGSAK